MNLVIHDLSAKQWSEISADYEGWKVVSDDGAIRPCIGCFGCWYRTPGKCVIPDGYEDMGPWIHHADEVVVISRYTYGGFSGFVKNAFDRCIGYVLPQFEVIKGETHHKKRYDEDKPFTFIFYGPDLSDEQKASARSYVEAVCTNIRGHVKELVFRESVEPEAAGAREECEVQAEQAESMQAKPTERQAAPAERPAPTVHATPGKVVLLNGSMRSVKGNSAKFARKLKPLLKADPEIIDLRDNLDDMSGLVRMLEEAETLVLCMPLYVDGMPAQVIRLFETFRSEYRGSSAKIYLLANMGLYESSQLRNLFEAVRQWCGEMDFEYCGGLGISAGELLGALSQLGGFKAGATRKVAKGMEHLARAINAGAVTEDVYAEPFMFPRWLYIYIANTNWNNLARKAGNKPEDLYRQL